MAMENNNITRNNSIIDDSFKREKNSISSSLNSLKTKKICIKRREERNTSDSKIPSKSITSLKYTFKNISNDKTPNALSKDEEMNNKKNKIKKKKRKKNKNKKFL
jgi:hypothetical protein